MDVAEGDRPREAEDVAAAEVRQLLGDDSRVDQGLHLDPERLVDHGQEHVPGRHGDADDQELRPLRTPEVTEQDPVHQADPIVSAGVAAAMGVALAAASPSGSASSYSSR